MYYSDNAPTPPRRSKGLPSSILLGSPLDLWGRDAPRESFGPSGWIGMGEVCPYECKTLLNWCKNKYKLYFCTIKQSQKL